MSRLRVAYPAHDAPEVATAREQFASWTRADSRLQSFFRYYYGPSLNRLAMNVVMLRRLLRPGMRWLDVGSFGVESIWLKREVDSLQARALSFEGNCIGLENACLSGSFGVM